MLRRLGLLLVALVAFGAAFLTTSLASSRQPQLRANFPAANLPQVALSAGERVTINNLLGIELGARAGITADSYDHARVVGHTSVGPLYLLLGTSGACLYLNDAVSCGDPAQSPDAPLSLLVSNRAGNAMVGGGVTAQSARSVSIAAPGAARVTKAVPQGAFVVTEADRVPVVRHIAYSAEN
jgi:hypothetical protein